MAINDCSWPSRLAAADASSIRVHGAMDDHCSWGTLVHVHGWIARSLSSGQSAHLSPSLQQEGGHLVMSHRHQLQQHPTATAAAGRKVTGRRRAVNLVFISLAPGPDHSCTHIGAHHLRQQLSSLSQSNSHVTSLRPQQQSSKGDSVIPHGAIINLGLSDRQT